MCLAGHSLGGALAQVFAAALATHHPELAKRVTGIYTYGMPRVGDAAFCQAMEKAFPTCAFRITHAADIIPLVNSSFRLFIIPAVLSEQASPASTSSKGLLGELPSCSQTGYWHAMAHVNRCRP